MKSIFYLEKLPFIFSLGIFFSNQVLEELLHYKLCFKAKKKKFLNFRERSKVKDCIMGKYYTMSEWPAWFWLTERWISVLKPLNAQGVPV